MKTKKTLLLILGVLLAAAVVVGLVFGVKALIKAGQTPDAESVSTTGAAPTGTGETVDPTAETLPPDPIFDPVRTKAQYTDEALTAEDPRLDKVVAECGDYTLTNRQAQTLYYMQYYAISQYYGYYLSMIGLDPNTPLYQQASPFTDLSWEQFLLYNGISQNQGMAGDYEVPCFRMLAAFASNANAHGIKLSAEDEASFANVNAQIEEMAVSRGFASADEMVQADMGISADLESYLSFERLYSLAVAFQQSDVYTGINPSDEELEAYRAANPDKFEGIDTEARTATVRHILFLSDRNGDQTVTDEEKAEAKAKAEELLAVYLSDPTEENFAKLAGENTEDEGSAETGGLYAQFPEGRMVEAFNDWCFDEARQAGDTDIVETEYGFHIMYFIETELAWKASAVTDIRTEHFTEPYPMTVRYEDLVLAPLPLPEAE